MRGQLRVFQAPVSPAKFLCGQSNKARTYDLNSLRPTSQPWRHENLDNAFVNSGIDNWLVTVHPVPVNHVPDSSSSFLLFGLGLLAISRCSVRRRKVVR